MILQPDEGDRITAVKLDDGWHIETQLAGHTGTVTDWTDRLYVTSTGTAQDIREKPQIRITEGHVTIIGTVDGHQLLFGEWTATVTGDIEFA